MEASAANAGEARVDAHGVPEMVPRAEIATRCPVPEEQLAWRYLCAESRIRRCTETLEIFSVRLGQRLLEIDVTLPCSARGRAKWMVPVAFLGKDPTAPDLKVTDTSGQTIVAPTMLENMAMTCAALRRLAAEQGIELGELALELIHQVVFEESIDAEVALWILEDEAPHAEALFGLLDRLVDQFLLWTPLEGEPLSEHQVSISRRAPRRLDPILRPSVEEVSFSYELRDGWADFLIEISTPPRRPDPSQVIERLLLALGLRSIEIESELDDTSRFTSYHHSVRAPRGFVVREVRVGRPRERDLDADREPELEEIEPDQDLLVQGHDSEIAHVHCARETNVSPLIVRTTLATAGHLTSLWTLVVVLSAAMLWVFERRGPDVGTGASGSLEVAAGALLLVPTLAAAWAIRSNEGAATRMVLSGTRLLLLLCGVLSVSAALTLAGVLPENLGPVAGLELYATLAYLAAVLVGASWVLSLRPTWYLYRHWLRTPLAHLRATVVLATLAALASLLAPFLAVGRYASAFALLAIGLCLVAIAANRIGSRLSEPRGPAPPLAFLAATLAFLAAGYWLDYYHVPSATAVQLFTVTAFVLLGAAAGRHSEVFSLRVWP